MGLLEMGAVRGMQDSQKMNREQLKKRRKSAKEIAERFPEKKKLIEGKVDLAKLRAFEEKMEKQKSIQKRNKIIAVISLLLLVSLVFWAIFN